MRGLFEAGAWRCGPGIALLLFCALGLFVPAALLDPLHPLSPPGLAHPAGTDALGRDEMIRLMQGGAQTVIIAIPASILAVLLGTAYGLAAGLVPPAAGRWLARLLDALLALPSLVVMMCGAALLPSGAWPLAALIGVAAWPPLARQVRAEMVALRQRDFVLAARQLGGGTFHIARAHLLPNMAGLLAVNATFLVGDAILGLSALSFLGLGVPPPAASWGDMLQTGLGLADAGAWWLILPPGMLIVASLGAVAAVAKRS